MSKDNTIINGRVDATTHGAYHFSNTHIDGDIKIAHGAVVVMPELQEVKGNIEIRMGGVLYAPKLKQAYKIEVSHYGKLLANKLERVDTLHLTGERVFVSANDLRWIPVLLQLDGSGAHLPNLKICGRISLLRSYLDVPILLSSHQITTCDSTLNAPEIKEVDGSLFVRDNMYLNLSSLLATNVSGEVEFSGNLKYDAVEEKWHYAVGTAI